MTIRSALAVLLVSLAAIPTVIGQEDPEAPLDIGKEEKVRVRLVTIDVLAVDRDDRTVPGLRKDDFALEVDGDEVEIDTFDASCAGGAMDLPASTREVGLWTEPAGVADASHRVVLAFDYLHLPITPCDKPPPCFLHTQALRQARKALEHLAPGDEEIMVVALDGALRVEQTFTSDRDAVAAALDRMENDVSLFAGNFEHGSEVPLFRGLEILLDLLDTVEGSKAVVLFSGGTGPGGGYDPQFRHLATMAATSRTSIYPVDCAGLYAKNFT